MLPFFRMGDHIFSFKYQQQISGDSWMYPYQRTSMGNPYISPILRGYKLGEQNPQESHPRTPAKYHGAHTYVKCTRMSCVPLRISGWGGLKHKPKLAASEVEFQGGVKPPPSQRGFQTSEKPYQVGSRSWSPPSTSWTFGALRGGAFLRIGKFLGGGSWDLGVLKRDWKQMDIVDGQIIISFHQPRFLSNRVNSLTKPPFGGPRSCEVAIIWPEYVHILLMEEILHQLADSLSHCHYLQGFIHPRC